jgi:hypothetical protein
MDQAIRPINDLETYFRRNDKKLIHKWNHYFEIYERHFSRFRGKDIVLLEIGVSQGGSLQMWKNYFGGRAKIYGVDIDPRCKDLEEENIKIFIGSQSDPRFLRELRASIPPIDILIDDGGHTMRQQIVTFQELYGHVKNDGVYLCEDNHTSYWLEWGGGNRRAGTFIEFSKRLIDKMHAWHSEERGLKVDDFTRTTGSMHYYDSILVIEKQLREKPFHEKTGLEVFDRKKKRSLPGKIAKGARIVLLTAVNKTLRALGLPGWIWR